MNGVYSFTVIVILLWMILSWIRLGSTVFRVVPDQLCCFGESGKGPRPKKGK
jgi:hypothetical protein